MDTNRLKASASATTLFDGMSMAECVTIAEAAGFSALEFQLLYGSDAEHFAPLIGAKGLEVALINLDLGDFWIGGPGYSGVPGRQKEFLTILDQGFENACALGAKLVHIGPSRVPAAAHRDRCLTQLRDNLQRTLDRFSSTDIIVTIEPLNTKQFPDVLLNSPEVCVDTINTIGSARLALQYDIYHASMEGRNIGMDLYTMADKIAHIQFADNPGRHEPGTGGIAFDRHFERLRQLGYQHFVGAEYWPSLPVEETFSWMALL